MVIGFDQKPQIHIFPQLVFQHQTQQKQVGKNFNQRTRRQGKFNQTVDGYCNQLRKQSENKIPKYGLLKSNNDQQETTCHSQYKRARQFIINNNSVSK